MRRRTIPWLAAFALAGLCGCRSLYTSIERGEDGTYTMTRFTDGRGEVVQGTYDPATKTMTVERVYEK